MVSSMHLHGREYSASKGNEIVNLTELRVFLTFQTSGGIGILVILLTVLFARKIYRHFTWLNFCVTWVIYCLSYTLLAISGQQTRRDEPPYALCLTQASLVYAAPPLVSMSTFALVLQLWFTLTNALKPPKAHQSNQLRNTLLILSPYLVWLGFIIAILVVGTLRPKSVQRSGHFTYCTITGGNPGPGSIAAVFVAAVLIVLLCLDMYIGTALYRNWRALRGSDHPGQVPLSLIVRVALFSFVCVIGIGCAFVFLSSVSYFAGNTIIALMPVIAFLVFGTQRDILNVWFFWRR